MRTKQYIQVESIVAKYVTLASNTETVKKVREELEYWDKVAWGNVVPVNFMQLFFDHQLLGYVYKLRAGDVADPDVVEEYGEATSYYIKGLLQQDEEQFLVDNFDVFVDYMMDNNNMSSSSRHRGFATPQQWSCLVPYLLENKQGNVFIAQSDTGKEFVGLNGCELTVEGGFENAAIRALAYGLSIHKHSENEDVPLWSDFEEGQFNAVVMEVNDWGKGFLLLSLEESFDSAWRIVKDGGEILLCIPEGIFLKAQSKSLRNKIIGKKVLRKVIQLPGQVLLHIVKKPHDSLVMCDAREISKGGKVDVDAFINEIEMAERKESLVVRRYSYDMLNGNILLPAYYLHFPTKGTPFRQLLNVDMDSVLSDECSPKEKVVTVNHLSKVFTKGAFKVDELPNVRTDRFRRYSRVTGPVVIMAVSKRDIAVGYTTDNTSFLVPSNLYPLKPKEIDVKYLAAKLLCKPMQKQLTSLVSSHQGELADGWSKLVLMDLQAPEEQQSLVQETLLKDYAMQESYAAMQDKGFKKAIRLRKHALSQNISAFDSLFRSLEYCMSEHKGNLRADDIISPVSHMTVGEAMDVLHTDLENICKQVSKLTDEQDWGKCEAIEPQEFIENYEKEHQDAGFRFSHSWEEYETNRFRKDWIDKKTGKIIFHKGDSENMAWFPRKALQQVFDNIISNAREHGFNDKSRNGFVIRTSWYTDSLDMIIMVSNNGAPLPSDLNTDLILEYGYTTALNKNGHSGIGGGEIAEIMHKYGGNVRIESTPDKKFTVTYVLTMPLASLY